LNPWRGAPALFVARDIDHLEEVTESKGHRMTGY